MFKSLNHFKLIAVRQFFIEPADQNYILARWMIANDFYPEYFWQASQAIEKYLKAGLVLQEISTIKIRHDLNGLYKVHCDTYGELAFTSFIKPHDISDEYWTNNDVSHYVNRINDIGDPDTRYGLNGWYRFSDDIFKLDQLCWNLRRLSVGLNWIISEVTPNPSQDNNDNSTYRDKISNCKDYHPLSPIKKLEKKIFNFGEKREDILSAWNFEYPNKTNQCMDAPINLFNNIPMFNNSYLALFLNGLSEISPESKDPSDSDKHLLKGMYWLVEKIKIPPDAKKYIKEKLDILKI